MSRAEDKARPAAYVGPASTEDPDSASPQPTVGAIAVNCFRQVLQEELQREFHEGPVEILHICVSPSPAESENEYDASDELDDDMIGQNVAEDQYSDMSRRIQAAIDRADARKGEWYVEHQKGDKLNRGDPPVE